MIATKLIIQSILGLGAIAGVAGGSYMLMGSSDEYFLVTSVAEATTDNAADLELWTEPKNSTTQTSLTNAVAEEKATPKQKDNKTTKNYKCQIGTGVNVQNDDTCKIFSITVDDTNKTALLKAQLTKTSIATKPTKADLKAKKFFLLKTTSSIYNSWNFNEKNTTSKTIKLMSNIKTTPKVEKSYATLTVHAKVVNGKIIGTTNTVVGIVTSDTITTSTDTTKTYKCGFEDKKNAEMSLCTVTKLTKPTVEPKINNINFSSVTIPETQASSTEITKGEYYAIKWTDKKWNISNLTNNVVVFVEETPASGSTAATTKKSNIKIESSILVNPENTIKEVIFLK